MLSNLPLEAVSPAAAAMLGLGSSVSVIGAIGLPDISSMQTSMFGVVGPSAAAKVVMVNWKRVTRRRSEEGVCEGLKG